MHKAICKYIDASQRCGNKQSSGEERSRGARPCGEGTAGVGWTCATVEDTVPRGAGGGDPTLDGAPGFLSKVGGAVEANLQRGAHQAPPTVPSSTDLRALGPEKWPVPVPTLCFSRLHSDLFRTLKTPNLTRSVYVLSIRT